MTALKEKIPLYEEIGMRVIIEETPFTIIILNPIMIRAHKRDFSSRMIFVDSSGSCDQTSTSVTFILAAAKTGAIPLKCVFHSDQSEANYTLVFNLLRESLGADGFNGLGYPKIIMTDDSTAERNALRTVFPESIVLLCSFHFCQAF